MFLNICVKSHFDLIFSLAVAKEPQVWKIQAKRELRHLLGHPEKRRRSDQWCR